MSKVAYPWLFWAWTSDWHVTTGPLPCPPSRSVYQTIHIQEICSHSELNLRMCLMPNQMSYTFFPIWSLGIVILFSWKWHFESVEQLRHWTLRLGCTTEQESKIWHRKGKKNGRVGIPFLLGEEELQLARPRVFWLFFRFLKLKNHFKNQN